MIKIKASEVTLRDCEQCKQPFVPARSSAGRFCSSKCSGAHRSAQVERVPCTWCGERTRYRVDLNVSRKYSYCSPACMVLHRESLRPSLAERFWKNVAKSDEPDGCWLWIGHRDDAGYGRLNVKLEDGGKTQLKAHRLSWEINVGPIPDGKKVLHNCPGGNDNPTCVRPSHLWIGTQLENMQDCARKGRNTRGERAANAKVTEEQVSKMRRRYAAGEVTQIALALEFHMSPSSINAIIAGTRWKHVPQCDHNEGDA